MISNTAIAHAQDLVKMAAAMKLAVEAGRLAWLAGQDAEESVCRPFKSPDGSYLAFSAAAKPASFHGVPQHRAVDDEGGRAVQPDFLGEIVGRVHRCRCFRPGHFGPQGLLPGRPGSSI